MIMDFRLEPAKVCSMPLAVGASCANGKFDRGLPRKNGKLMVFYVGTLVPLHGIQVVTEAIRLLDAESGIEFHLVGDGQDAAALHKLLAEDTQRMVTWERSWLPMEEIAHRMAQADICLGVFGGPGKAARVLPFKVYHALAAGIPVLTQADYSLPEGLPVPPLLTVAANANDLAKELQRLARDRSALEDISRQSRDYFERYLGPERIMAAWAALLQRLPEMH
jgi:glycosyltransferase involved in cell wall biosynthesis